MVAVVTTDERELLAKLWTVCEQLLHTEKYKECYVDWLSDVLLANGNKSQDILDTAAGVGFPAMQLFDQGFTNVWCADADPDLLRSLIAKTGELSENAPVLCLRWQDLPSVVMNQFESVLCLDASIGFMDSWGHSAMVSGPQNVCIRVKEVLRNFYEITRPGGRFFIGLQKNNHRGNSERYVMEVGTATLNGHKATAIWDMRYDWPARRKTWINKVEYQGDMFEQKRHSYLFDKYELMGFVTEIGFEKAHEVPTPDFFYEDVVVATKG